jgi:hypothetical protein
VERQGRDSPILLSSSFPVAPAPTKASNQGLTPQLTTAWRLSYGVSSPPKEIEDVELGREPEGRQRVEGVSALIKCKGGDVGQGVGEVGRQLE